MAQGHVRPAVATDAPEIARLQLSTWRTAYSQLLPLSVLAEVETNLKRITSHWRHAIISPPTPEHRVLVAVEQTAERADIAGFCASGTASDHVEIADNGKIMEITPLLVEPRWGRRGHGSRLLSATVDFARKDQHTVAMVWILDGDVASRKFYESAGWKTDGATRVLDMGDATVPELRLTTLL